MKSKYLYPIWIITCIFYSCSNKKQKIQNVNCGIRIDELLKKDSNRLEINDQTTNGKILQLIDKTKDSVIGSYYFYPNGALKSYKFFSLPYTYQYNEEYDSLGNVTLIEGSPLVLHSYRQIDSEAVRFTFLFSSLHKEYQYMTISTNGGFQFPGELLDNAHFTNIKSITFDLPVARTFKSTIIYTECKLFNTCLNKQWTLKDTAVFADRPL